MLFPAEITTQEFDDSWSLRDEKWRDAVEQILRREGFGTPNLELLSGSNLTYSFDGRYVFKAFPPDAAHEGVIERDLLHACNQDELRVVPQLITSGEDGWNWIVMSRLPGRELRPLRDELSSRDRLRITEQLADWAAEFHRSPSVQAVEPHSPNSWGPLQDQLRDGLAAKLKRRGLGESWLEQLPEFYSDWHPLPATNLVHADLHDMNILVEQTDDGWNLTGVFDFADAMPAPLIYELAAPLLFIARGARPEVEALCNRVLGEVPTPRVLLQWSLLHRFAHLQYYLDHFDYLDGETLEEVALSVAGLR